MSGVAGAALLLLLLLLLAAHVSEAKKVDRKKTWGERMAWTARAGANSSALFSEEGLVKSMDNRIKQLWQQRNRLATIHVHAPKAGGTALAYALASSCNCSLRHSLSKDSASVCTDCRRVLVRHRSLPGWVRFPCTYSRVTGWPCGVAHAPLALLRMLPHCTVDHTIEQRGKPLFVVMLRDPWQRFQSEWKSWGGYRLNTLDWSAVSLPRDDTLFPFFNNSQVTFHPQVARPRGERATLEDLVGLPADFMLHNRYTKMIGGDRKEFNFTFNRTNYGSRWLGSPALSSIVMESDGDVAYPGTMRIQHDRALQNLQRAPNVLPLLQERFGESLCVLEVILGSLQKFSWEEKNHSHGATRGAYEAPARSGVAKSSKMPPVPHHVYQQWVSKNTDDLLLFNHTKKIFDVQLRSALHHLYGQVTAAGSGQDALREARQHQPHCVVLPEWKSLIRG